MIRRTVPFATLALLVATAAPALVAQGPAARVDALMADYGPDGPGAVVGVVRNGEVVFVKAYGLANLEHGIPLTRESVLDVGSVAKQLTGFAIALLADRGELSLDDDIRAHLPDVPDFGPTITVRHLLHHMSGLREIYTANSMAGWRGGDGLLQSDALALTRHMTELNFEPGARYLYCNTAYMLLADIVAEVSGMSFPEFMAENVFGPLGMEHTTIMDVQGKVIPGAAESYGGSGDPDYLRVFDNSGIMGAGGVYTTVEDLLAWVANLGTGEVGGPGVLEMHRTRGILNDGDTLAYAMGINVGTWRGQRRLSHGGSSAGYRAALAYFPEFDAGVVTMSNYASFDGAIADEVVEAFFGTHLEPAVAEEDRADEGEPANDAAPLATEITDELQALEGRYYSPELETVYTLEVLDGDLTGLHRRHGRFPLASHEEDVLRGPGFFGTARVQRDSIGNVIGLRVDNGRVLNLWFERMGG